MFFFRSGDPQLVVQWMREEEEEETGGSDIEPGWSEWEGRVQGFAWLDSWTEKQAISGRDLYVWLLPQILRERKLKALGIA